MNKICLKVNGKVTTVEIDPRTLLAALLRDELGLTGTHIGCDTTQCGACVVHINGQAVKSCTILAVQCANADVITIEGIGGTGDTLHPMQAAFCDHHGLQCGYCTPGMIMVAIDIVHRLGFTLDDDTIREELDGNLCRCTGYDGIVAAIKGGARSMAAVPMEAAVYPDVGWR